MEGWIELNEWCDVLIENGVVVRGVMDGRTVYPYIAKNGGEENASRELTLRQLKGRIKRGTARMA